MATVSFAVNTVLPRGTSFWPTASGTAAPAGFTTIDTHVDLTGVPAVDTVSVMLQISDDNGVTWRDWCGLTAPGGAFTNPKNGATFRELICTYPTVLDPNVTTLRVRTDASGTTDLVNISGVLA